MMDQLTQKFKLSVQNYLAIANILMTCADSCKLTLMKNEDLLRNIKDNYELRTLPSSPPVFMLNIDKAWLSVELTTS